MISDCFFIKPVRYQILTLFVSGLVAISLFALAVTPAAGAEPMLTPALPAPGLTTLLRHYEATIFWGETKNPGSDAAILMRALRAGSLLSLLPEIRRPEEQFVIYLARRIQDEQFATALTNKLFLQSGFEPHAENLSKAAETFRTLAQAAQDVRYHWEMSAAEKRELLEKADVPWRLRIVRRLLRQTLGDMGYLDPEANPRWAPFYMMLQKDLERECSDANAAYLRRIVLGDKMVGGIVDTFPFLPRYADVIDEARRREQQLEKLRLTLSFTGEEPALPAVNVRRYAEAVAAHDRCVVNLFASPDVKASRQTAKLLYMVFNIRDCLRRQLTLARWGYPRFAAELMLALARDAEAADRFTRHEDRSAEYLYMGLRYALAALAIDPGFEQAADFVVKATEKIEQAYADHDTEKDFAIRGLDYAASGDYPRAYKTFAKGHAAYPADSILYEWLVVATYCVKGWDAAWTVWHERHPSGSAQNHEALKGKLAGGLDLMARRAEEQKMRYVALRHWSVLFGLTFGKVAGVYTNQERHALDRMVSLYGRLPFKPTPPLLARNLAAGAHRAMEKADAREAERLIRQAIAAAPWWPEAHYDAAIIWFAGFQDVYLWYAVREMEISLKLDPSGAQAEEGRRKMGRWRAALDEYTAHGITFGTRFN